MRAAFYLKPLQLFSFPNTFHERPLRQTYQMNPEVFCQSIFFAFAGRHQVNHTFGNQDTLRNITSRCLDFPDSLYHYTPLRFLLLPRGQRLTPRSWPGDALMR